MLDSSLAKPTFASTKKSTLRESQSPPADTHIKLRVVSFYFSNLSATLKLSQSEGEKWIVNLIRETRMGADAKIDLEKVFLQYSRVFPGYKLTVMFQNVVTTQRNHPPVYQAVIEKTRGLARRTQDLSIDINRRAFGEQEAQKGGNREEGKRNAQPVQVR